ncbi:hypothetical protein [Streptomyces sp. NPDC059176]|uniref:hypothetical protein n=1 Tax=unclassified Streptomyces TaxID=2593676 RepID=UPI003675338A
MAGPSRSTWARIALAIGLLGVVINLVDWAIDGRLVPSDAFPLFLAAAAAGELTSGVRQRVLRGAASAVLAAVGLAAGVPAAADLVRGDPVDWLDLTVGVLVVLWALVGGAALVGRLRRRGSAAT